MPQYIANWVSYLREDTRHVDVAYIGVMHEPKMYVGVERLGLSFAKMREILIGL